MRFAMRAQLFEDRAEHMFVYKYQSRYEMNVMLEIVLICLRKVKECQIHQKPNPRKFLKTNHRIVWIIGSNGKKINNKQ